MQHASARLLLACAAALTLTHDAGATIVVDPSGLGDATTLQQALDVATDGELILLKSGHYESAPGGLGFTIHGKGLALVADAGAEVTLPWLAIRNLPAGQSFVVRGLRFDPGANNPKPTRPGVEVTDSQGGVWLEDCSIRGADGWDGPDVYVPSDGQHGVSVENSHVVLQRCTVLGGKGAPASFGTYTLGGGHGVRVSHGRVALHDCEVTGGGGSDGDDTLYAILDGGHGVAIWVDALASIAGGTTTGGEDGEVPWELSYSGNGVLAYSASSFAWVRDGVFAAGPAELPGGPGEAVGALKPQNITTFTAPSRSLSITSPLREGEAGSIEVHGEPGDQLLLLASSSASIVPLAAKQGVLALEAPLLLPLTLGSITDPGGELLLPVTAPHLLPGLDGLVTLLQLAVVRDGAVTLEGGSAFVWLSQGL